MFDGLNTNVDVGALDLSAAVAAATSADLLPSAPIYGSLRGTVESLLRLLDCRPLFEFPREDKEVVEEYAAEACGLCGFVSHKSPTERAKVRESFAAVLWRPMSAVTPRTKRARSEGGM